MTEKELSVLVARIKEELTNVELLLEELEERSLVESKSKEIKLTEDNFVLRAVGSVFHDFYVAVENIFEMICREVDELTLQGNDWHMKLLKQMSIEVPGVRPAVISKDTLLKLDKYRAFRHVFRNVYGFNLDSARLKDLLAEFPQTADSLKHDLRRFIEKLEIIANS